MAIGGETTGVVVTTADGAIELKLTEKQRPEAEKLKGKVVVVSGKLEVKPRVTGKGVRLILDVTSLKGVE